MGNQNDITAGSVELDTQDGVAFIEQASPLTRLHYFDGKFLKADALAQEQAYHRTQVRLSNLAGGWGVVHGLGIGLAGDQLTVGGGLAITPAGHFVLTVGDVQAKVTDLLKVATATATVIAGGNPEFGECAGQPAGGVQETASLGLYEITVGPIEGLCGNEPVYGALCESACVADSRHPYWREGLVLRLRPITLKLPVSTSVPFSTVHLRNRVASAYFAVEPGSTPSALSAAGLASGVWCQPASLYGRDEVVIGLLAREGGINRVIDAWSGRRERMEAQARGHWQGRMAMRPWNVYLAQILQFQCQLSGVFSDSNVVVTVPDDCDQIRAVLDETRKEIEALQKTYAESTKKLVEALAGGKPTKEEAKQLADQVQGSYAELFELSEKLSGVEAGQGALPANRLLLNSGFAQLPPAGYLPVQPGKTPLAEQLSRLFGEGVRLFLRAARADVLPHLLEEAQHMERISLTRGLDQPGALEEIEIFVPDGQAVAVAEQHPGTWWSVDTSGDGWTQISGILSAGIDNQAALVRTQSEDAVLAMSADQPAAAAAKKRLAKPKASGFIDQRQDALTGLARTEGREDGSFGLAMVFGSDADLAEPDYDDTTAPQEYKLAAGIYAGNGVEQVIEMGVYVAADIAADPFDLSVGDDTQVKLELRQAATQGTLGIAVDARLSGTLSVLVRQAKAGGRVLLVVELALVGNVTIRSPGRAPRTRQHSLVQRLGLVRQGDGGTGVLLVDDEDFDARTAPLSIDWDDAPRLATVTLSAAAAAGQTVVTHLMQGLASSNNDGIALDAGNDASGVSAYEGSADTLATLQGLAQAPQPASPLGAQALNTLVKLSEATQDSAFLVRARKRLFPALESSGQQDITAVLDWVLFRRRRPTFCDPVCVAPVAPDVEAFQVWHIKVSSPEELKALRNALDQDDAEALSQFKLQPVGVLRYLNDSTQPEETAAKVRGMWQQASPGSKVVLGRAWETTPTAGQGWQNHFRLRAMLEQIASLTTPPPQGDGSITTLAKAPAPLAGQSLDGGFLVVTTGAKDDTVTNQHRVLLVGNGLWSDVEPSFQQGDPAGAFKELSELIKSEGEVVVDLTLEVKDNTLTQAQQDMLAEADKAWILKNGDDNPYAHTAYGLQAQSVGSGEKPGQQTEAVADTLGASVAAAYTVPIGDLGGGADVMTVIVYEQIYAQ